MTEFEAEVGTGLATLDGGQALEAVTRGEIDIQISTAKRYPRSVAAFLKVAEELATRDEETAESMFYSLPAREGSSKRIEGPSVRCAEVVAYGWGNLRVDSRVIAIDERFITAAGTAFDLERNLASRHEVKRRITNKNGRRYTDDMIVVTGNAACSIAMREAVFKIVPRALVKSIYDKARATSQGLSLPMATRREKAIGWFEKQGVARERILRSLGRNGIEEVTQDDLLTLTGTKTAVKEGDIQLDEAFPVAGEPSQEAGATADRLRQVAEAKRAGAGGNGAAAAQPATQEDEVPPRAFPELDAAGLSGEEAAAPAPAPPPAPPAEAGTEQPTSEEGLQRFVALVMDTQRGTGRKPLAEEGQRTRLRTVGNTTTARGQVKAGDRLLALAGDAQLSKAQAMTLLAYAVEADLLAGDGTEGQAPPAPAAGADAQEDLLG